MLLEHPSKTIVSTEISAVEPDLTTLLSTRVVPLDVASLPVKIILTSSGQH